MSARWPLTGRDEERTALHAALTGSGTAGCVVVSGAAGVGKTRLARDVAASAAEDGWVVRWAGATSASANVPLGAFAALLPPIDPARERDALTILRRAVQAMREVGERVVLGVDDAHLLDDLSATLVHQLALAGEIAMLVTVRSGESLPDPIVALWKDGLATRVELQPLSLDEVGRLVSSVLEGHVDIASRERLWELSLGNPLFLRELLDGALESGDLAQENGLWRFTLRAGPSPRLIEVIEARLGRLDDETRDVLTILAFAEPLSATTLERMHPARRLDELQRRGLVVETTSERRAELRLAHPLYAEVLRAQTPPSTARTIQRCLADEIEQLGARRREDLLRVAMWRLESRSGSDPERLGEAAAAAIAMRDAELAEILARTARDNGGSFTADISLIYALNRAGRPREGADVASAVDLAVLSDHQRVLLAEAWAQSLWFLDELDGAAEMLVRVERSLRDRSSVTLIRAMRAEVLALDRRTVEALELGLPLITAADAEDRTKVELIESIGTIWVLSGDGQRALDVAMSLVEPARELEESGVYGLTSVATVVIWALIALGRLGDAKGLLDMVAEDPQLARVVSRPLLAFGRARVALLEGRIRTAIELLRESSVATFGQHTGAAWGWALMTEAHALSGDVAGAEDAAGRSTAGEGAANQADPDMYRARAWLHVATGETSRAIDELLSTADVLRDAGYHALELFALHDAARLGAEREVADRIAELTSIVDGLWPNAMAQHVSSLLTRDGDGLDRAAEAFAAIGANLHAAECAAQAAHQHRQNGRIAPASASTARAEQLSALCEGARSPVLASARTTLPLTRREREVAMLAARGASSKQIAERLVLSVRTVEGYLQQTYSKLGISSRTDLAAMLGEAESG